MNLRPFFELFLPVFEIGGGFGDIVAIFGDSRFGRGGGGLLPRDCGALTRAEELVDENRERGAGPSKQYDRGDQRDALLPHRADAQETHVAVRANEDFMVLKQRRKALAPMAQARRFR